MCGIVGYVGHKQARAVLLESLKRLEYRGYDSCGISTLGDRLFVYKDVGRVVDVEKAIPDVEGGIGIGHTRWATHGEVTSANAHPHTDCGGKFAVVHNGVIDNFQQLRKDLIGEGHRFTSDTDTEVIAHLVEKYYQGDISQAVAQALADITGTYAIVVLAQNHSELVVAKNESPLVIGLGDNENFVASDVSALLDYTNRVIYLEDGDVGVVTDKSVTIKNKGNSDISYTSEFDRILFRFSQQNDRQCNP